MIKMLLNKLKESSISIIPLYLFVIIINFTPLLDLSLYEIFVFSVSSIILIIGISLFNMGADIAMMPMGKITGQGLSKNKKLLVLLIVGLILGFFITIAEPDLTVLANQVKNVINPKIFTISIGIGVGVFLLIALLRIIFKINLSTLLSYSYMVLFAVALIALLKGKGEMLGVAFDSGGVTTGPITVPFLMALGAGSSSILSKKKDKDASFGLIALCSVGPIIICLILTLFTSGSIEYQLPDYSLSTNFFKTLLLNLLECAKDVGIILVSIFALFLLLDVLFLKIDKKRLSRICIGVLYTFIGLILFLASVESGYMSIGYKIGVTLANKGIIYLIIFSFIIGALTVLAEPSVHILNKQVEEITNGLVKRKTMLIALAIGVGIAIGLSIIRIIFKFNILYYLIPGYILCLGLSFFVPKIYTSIAFDSGGVCSGAMTSAFVLPMSIGACFFLNGEASILSLSFGVVALIALTPLIAIQLLGFIAIVKDKINSRKAIKHVLSMDDEIIINFME